MMKKICKGSPDAAAHESEARQTHQLQTQSMLNWQMHQMAGRRELRNMQIECAMHSNEGIAGLKVKVSTACRSG